MVTGGSNVNPSTRHDRSLKEFVDRSFLMIHILEPTRIKENTASTLDQILTNFNLF